MLNKYQSENRAEIKMISIEDLVPNNHILRDIDRAINFNFIYDEVIRSVATRIVSLSHINKNRATLQHFK